MAGQTVRILPRTDYNFTLTANSQVITVVVARKLDTSAWREGVLLARLHACANWPGGTIKVNLAPDGYTEEDPGLIWNFAATTLVTFTSGTDTPPSAKNAEFGTPFGPLAQIQLVFSNLATGAGLLTPSISIDLNLKGE
jgi:hypothetical protein